MEGVVKSYVAEKRYGFIDGADGKSYFFHANEFTPKLDAGAVLDGALISFDPTPTPKGLAAKRLQLARSQAVEWVAPGQFLILREDTPKRGRLVAEVDAVTVSGRESPMICGRGFAASPRTWAPTPWSGCTIASARGRTGIIGSPSITSLAGPRSSWSRG